MKKSKTGLSFLVTALALSVAVSFVAISHLMIKSGKENPSASIDVSVSENNSGGASNGKNESSVSEQANPEAEEAAPEAEAATPETEEERPQVELVGGKGGVYHKEIQVFHAEYGENGEITVKSAAGDRVVAPGTENQYDLYVRNVGEVPIRYELEAQSFLTVVIDGEEVQIPVDASFSNPNDSYLLGAENSLEHLGGLDGVKDSQGLSANRQAKYTLTWGWPYDGDDEFDTLLGNLAAEGEELTVKVAFNVTASYDPDASGGTPMTGDMTSIGLWVALFVISAFALIILLFLRKKEQDEENSQTRKEKKQ